MLPAFLALLCSAHAQPAAPPYAAEPNEAAEPAQPAAPVRGYVDLHIHIAAHLAVPVYGGGPEAAAPAGLTNRHALRQQIFSTQLSEPGPSILVSLAYANPFYTDFESRRTMRARIERQLDYVEAFSARHADRFGVALTPDEARSIVASGRTAIVHGIEGGTKILDGPEDAMGWAARGVAVITPIHLADNAIGGAWCQGGALFVMNVPGCWREGLAPARHGLTAVGVERIGALVDAGIVVDMAHMSRASFAEAIAILGKRSVAPVYSHVTADAVRRDPVALTDGELGEIASLGGLVGVTANLSHLAPRPLPEDRSSDRCPGSIDDFQRQWDHVVSALPGQPVAWGSDFQGGVDHPRPKYGARGCESAPSGRELNAFDVEGLAHTGLVEPMFALLAASGSDRRPLDRSAERFLTIWARARAVSVAVGP